MAKLNTTTSGIITATLTADSSPYLELQQNGVTLRTLGSAITSSDLSTEVVPIGVGQTWQDVTASRAYGTTYTNSTGRPITVVISFGYNGSAAVLGQLTVSGVAIQFGQINSAYINVDSGTAIVPSGATYVFTATSGSLGISKWLELR